MRLEIADLARIDLERLRDQGVVRFGSQHTRRYLLALTNSFKTISQTPFMARERTEFRIPTRIHHFKAHIIAYRVESDVVKIIRIFSKYQDWMELL